MCVRAQQTLGTAFVVVTIAAGAPAIRGAEMGPWEGPSAAPRALLNFGVTSDTAAAGLSLDRERSPASSTTVDSREAPPPVKLRTLGVTRLRITGISKLQLPPMTQYED